MMGLAKEDGIEECEKYDLAENCQDVNYDPAFELKLTLRREDRRGVK
jgi:hypothetical protein